MNESNEKLINFFILILFPKKSIIETHKREQAKFTLNTGSVQRRGMPLELATILGAVRWIAWVLWTDRLPVFFSDTASFQLLNVIFCFLLENTAFNVYPTFTSINIMIKVTCLGLLCLFFLSFLFLFLLSLLLLLPFCLGLFPLPLEL